MVSGFRPSTGGSKDLDAAVRELITDTEQSNPDLRIANSPQAFTLQSRPARKLDWFGKSAVQENGRQLTERIRMIAFEQKAGVILYLVFVAPEPDFNSLLPVFERMQNSIRIR
jgi:beta-barrel assembly-enhancing protease